MFKNFKEAYTDILYTIFEFGVERNSAFGNSREILNIPYQIEKPFECFVEDWKTPRRPSVEYAEAFSDWVVSGSDKMPASLIELNPIADKFNYRREDLEAFELPSSFSVFYGPRIAQQYEHVKNELIAFPKTRRAVISILDGVNDNKMLSALRDGLLQKVEYPCTIALVFDVCEENKLNLTSIMRSQNMVSVWPYDFFIARKLLAKMAADVGLEPGTISGSIISAHIYERDYDYVVSYLKAEGLEPTAHIDYGEAA
uniref:Thymidylate synthase n=1 Tax=Ochrobactrum phage ORM_20 TaxID=2985243 RepID=A0A9N6WSQ2_9VIRU|nr:thymidylate synthase [Ochrobactrum phage ORM_20]